MSDYLTVKNLGLKYQDWVVKGLDFSIAKGKMVCLLGHSGSGKSSILGMLAGFITPSCGQIYLDGAPVLSPSRDRAVVFQEHALLPWLNAGQNIALALEDAHKSELDEWLDLVGLLDKKDLPISLLSGGQKQRIGIARALAMRPKLLLLDEPFGALDALTRERLQGELLALVQNTHQTALLITHDIDEALRLGDELWVLKNGTLTKMGNPLDKQNPLADPHYVDLRHELLGLLS